MRRKHLIVDARGQASEAQQATFERAKRLAIGRVEDADTYILITLEHDQMTFDVLVQREQQVRDMIAGFLRAMDEAHKGQTN
jgi:hypothetical protein